MNKYLFTLVTICDFGILILILIKFIRKVTDIL